MVESHSLKLVFGAARMNERISLFLARSLEDLGYVGATASMLSFLSTLECGINYGSEIARSLGISRQMVAKTVKELVRLGYLEQLKAQGKKKPILFTEKGEHLMSDARCLLAELDQQLCKAMGPGALEDLVGKLDTVQKLCSSRSDSTND